MQTVVRLNAAWPDTAAGQLNAGARKSDALRLFGKGVAGLVNAAIPVRCGRYLDESMRVIWMLCLTIITSAAVADESLWNTVKQDANVIVLMRNAESAGNRAAGDMLAWDPSGKCLGESTLTAQGRAQARRIGAAFEEHGIAPVVISSPMCRCSETAQIAFGRYHTDPALRQRPVSDTPGQEAFLDRASALLTQYRGDTPVVFVNHRPNIDSLTMELLDIGDLLVGNITDQGEVEVLGRIRVDP